MLDDNVVAEAVDGPGGRRFVSIHPDRFAQVVKAHRESPLALAAFLHGVTVHELTHLDGKMGDGLQVNVVADSMQISGNNLGVRFDSDGGLQATIAAPALGSS